MGDRSFDLGMHLWQAEARYVLNSRWRLLVDLHTILFINSAP